MRSRPAVDWKEEWKDLFTMHRAERRGMTALLIGCFIAAGWIVYEQFIRPKPLEDLATLEATWRSMDRPAPRTPGYDQRSERQEVVENVVLFPFDPNHLPLEKWVALGLSEKQAGSILKFEAKGGQFRTKRDLARMFVVKPDLYAKWESYIQLPDSIVRAKEEDHRWLEDRVEDHPKFEERTGRSAFPAREAVDVNTADTVALVALPGIGPSFARGIVKYRDRLGGFHSLDQLSEVYVLRDKPDAVAKLRTLLKIDTVAVRRFDVNTVSAEELGPHPYAGWKLAKALVSYRKLHGTFKNVQDIKGCVLVTDSVYRKLAPYLRAE